VATFVAHPTSFPRDHEARDSAHLKTGRWSCHHCADESGHKEGVCECGVPGNGFNGDSGAASRQGLLLGQVKNAPRRPSGGVAVYLMWLNLRARNAPQVL
jgi:hypothetical protein